MKIIINIFTLLCILLLLTTVVNAAPQITELSTINVKHGDTLTISGNDFGIKVTFQPVLWDTVDNISSYSSLSDGDVIPIGGENPWPSPYGNSSGRDLVKYNISDSQRNVGTAQYKATNEVGAYLDGLIWVATDYSYVSWWFKTEDDISVGDHASKFLRMSNSIDEQNRTFSWSHILNHIYSNPNYCTINWDTFYPSINTWYFMEAWFDSDAQTYTLRTNGQTLTSGDWSSCSSFSFNELWKIGFDGGGNNPPSITWWMDDIYVDKTFARVLIGNESSYASSTIFEMQIPLDWSSSVVTVDINQGAFDFEDVVYLYIVNADGNMNENGYPVTIGKNIEIRADVNQDSQINTTDAMLTLRNSLGLDMPETAWQASATTGDVNCDNISNSIDSMLLLRYSLGLDMIETEWCE